MRIELIHEIENSGYTFRSSDQSCQPNSNIVFHGLGIFDDRFLDFLNRKVDGRPGSATNHNPTMSKNKNQLISALIWSQKNAQREIPLDFAHRRLLSLQHNKLVTIQTCKNKWLIAENNIPTWSWMRTHAGMVGRQHRYSIG